MIFFLQHNNMKIKPLNVFNNTFYPELLAIVTVNFFFNDGLSTPRPTLFLYDNFSKSIFHYQIDAG